MKGGLGVEDATFAEDYEMSVVACGGEAFGDGEGLLFGATVSQVVLEDADCERGVLDNGPELASSLVGGKAL